MNNELFVTADGSHSLRSEHFGVPYHSVHGAIQESRHVFIDAGLAPLLMNKPGEVRILEMGLGTGLNALLTVQEAAAHPQVNFVYEAYELYPLGDKWAEKLNYTELLDSDAGQIRQFLYGPEGKWLVERDNFSFRKHQADFLRQQQRPYAPASFDLIYYDAFAPASQPELWTPEAMQVCYDALKPGGVFVTYCAKGQFKRDLRDTGFRVEPLPGPPGKREMTRGRKIG